MLARQFFYVCGGILLFAASTCLRFRQAGADYVDPWIGPVVTVYADENHHVALRSDGTLWSYSYAGWIQSDELPTFPVAPPGEIAFWMYDELITRDGTYWYVTGYPLNPHWERGQMIPPPTVDVRAKSWSGMKDGYRR